MAKTDKYSITDLKKDFPTEEACLALIFNTLHSKKCSCGGVYKPIKGRKQFQCSKCRFQIAPLSTSIFSKSDTKLSLWFHAIFIFSNAKSGISAKEMERQLGVTYKCAWRILSQIRKALKQSDSKLGGIVEADEGFFKDNVVLGVAKRKGDVRARVMDNRREESIAPLLDAYIRKGSTLMTDEAPVYKTATGFKRGTVNHSKWYVKGKAHVNTVESFFSHVKRSIRGTYKNVSKQHLQSYLDAFVFLRNNAGNDKARFGVLLGALLQSSR